MPTVAECWNRISTPREEGLVLDARGQWMASNRNGLAIKRVGDDGDWHTVRVSLAAVPEDYGPTLDAELETFHRTRLDSSDTSEERHLSTLGFSSDGRWVWCGATLGIWIFRMADLIERGADAKATWWHPTAPWTPFANLRNYVYGILEEPGGGAIRFSTLEARCFVWIWSPAKCGYCFNGRRVRPSFR